MSPQAVRVRTSSGWQDIAIQGPPGPPGTTPSARGYGLFSYAGADSAHRTYAPALTTDFNTMGGSPFANGRFNAPVTGKYMLVFTVEQFTMTVAAYIGVALLKNNASLLRSLNQATSPSSDGNPYKGGVQTFFVGQLNAGDYVNLQSWCQQGGNAYLVIEAILLDAPATAVAQPPILATHPGSVARYVAEQTVACPTNDGSGNADITVPLGFSWSSQANHLAFIVTKIWPLAHWGWYMKVGPYVKSASQAGVMINNAPAQNFLVTGISIGIP